MWLCALLLSQAGGLSPADGLETRLAPFLREHCNECHAGARPKGELDLSALLEAAAADGLAAWRDPLERVRERVLTDEMPPASRPRPHLEQVEQSLSWLELELDSKIADTRGMRRLNR
jgi:hypothetical protein